MLGVISVRKKKHLELMMKVHLVNIIQLAIVSNVIDERRKNNYHNKPVMYQV